ncbi:MAG: MFS transporter [Nonomuraea sp.]|nr:MFS transporter [Nonomuraea sp.]
MTGARLVRDRPTLLIYLLLAVFASYVYGLSAAVPLLRIDQRTSAAVASLHGTAMAVVTIAAGLALPALTRRYGRRATTWFGVAGMNAGMLLVMFSSALPLTLLGYGLAGGFGSVMLYAATAALNDHHGPAGTAAISEANAVAVIVGMAATFLISACAHTPLGWRAALLLTPVLTVLVVLAMGRVWTAPAVPPETSRGTGGEEGRATGAARCCSAAWRWSSASTCGAPRCCRRRPGSTRRRRRPG